MSAIDVSSGHYYASDANIWLSQFPLGAIRVLARNFIYRPLLMH